MSAHLLSDITTETLPRKRFTRDEINCLLETDFFAGQRYELLDGDLIEKMGQKAPHVRAIRRILKWLVSFVDAELVQVQLPIDLVGEDREHSIPEPDISVLKEIKEEHESRLAQADELVLGIEVADSSIRVDLSRKAELYARSGLPEYWVLDLNGRRLIAHRHTDGTQYRDIHVYTENEFVAMEGRIERIKVADLLPRRI